MSRLAHSPESATHGRPSALVPPRSQASTSSIADHLHCVHQRFEQCVAQSPNVAAILAADSVNSYGELNRQANQLARYLQRAGLRRGDIVNIFLPRSPNLIVSILAVLKAGGVYLPLDGDCPPARREFMLRDAKVRFALTLSTAARLDGIRTVMLDVEQAAIARENDDNLGLTTSPEDLAYIMYTSGSTGEPKGVEIRHRSVVGLVCNADYVDLGPHRTLLQFAPISFDASTFEIWGALLNGGRLALVPDGQPDLARLEALVVRIGSALSY
jgi:non-ribosomal peptide synthetase component F